LGAKRLNNWGEGGYDQLIARGTYVFTWYVK
jgi:hypothetical protein